MREDDLILIWQGCAPSVVKAVDSFCDRWKPYSTKSRAHSIFKLFEEEIEPAWNAYRDSLPPEHSGRELLRDLKLGQLARSVGFATLETILGAAIRRYCKRAEDFYQQMPPSLGSWFDTPRPDFGTDQEFEATLETLLIVARECHNKRPKKLQNGRSNRQFQEFCEHCGANTELSDQAKGQSRTGYEPDGAARLSAKYCWGHRPKFLDGSRNPEYLWVVRSKVQFDTEVKRLRLQSRSVGKPLANTGDPYLDLFYLNLLGPRAIFPDELGTLRNEARQLVDLRVDDRKKRMVIMRASGLSLAAIADAIGVKSRQAVSKSLAAIPAKYRFDLIANGGASDSEAAKEAFPSALIDAVGNAMNSPDVVEIMLNPDGILWAEGRTLGRKEIGRVSSVEAEKIIRFVASKCNFPLTEQAPIIEVDFASPRARFTGVLPPITDKPTFSITKLS